MKKIILVFAFASFVVSCQKIQAGSNKGVLKLEEGAERYTDDVQGSMSEVHVAAPVTETAKPQDSLRTAEVNEVTIKADSTKTQVNP